MKYVICLIAFILPHIAYAEMLDPNDKKLAQSAKPEVKECLADFGQRVRSKVNIQPISDLSFNEPMTQIVYKSLYWQESDRGVAYTLPVQANNTTSGALTTDVACFYSIVSGKLKFQYSQQIVQRL